MIGIEAFREVLRGAQLREILLIFETPDYFPGNRSGGSARGEWIAYLENERHCAEEAFVDRIVNLREDEWRDERETGVIWSQYKQTKTRFQGRIYKALARENAPAFKEMRNWRGQSAAETRKIHWMRRRRADALAKADGVALPPETRAPRASRAPAVDREMDLGERRLRSADRREV